MIHKLHLYREQIYTEKLILVEASHSQVRKLYYCAFFFKNACISFFSPLQIYTRVKTLESKIFQGRKVSLRKIRIVKSWS